MLGPREAIEEFRRGAGFRARDTFLPVYPAAADGGAPVGIHLYRDLELRWPGFAFRDGDLIDDARIHPEHLRRWRAANRDADASRYARPRDISGMSLVLPLAGYDVYGHWLLDFLPRAWLFTEVFGHGEEVNLVVPWDTPAFALRMLDQAFPMPRARLVRYGLPELIRLEMAIIPSVLHEDYRFHPAMNRFVGYLQDVVAAPSPPETPKLFVSRASLVDSRRPHTRRLANEAELRAALEADGFVTVSPESLPWAQQIALFSQARVIVGEGGSGLHNCLFARAARVVCLRPIDGVAADISALRGHALCAIHPQGEAADAFSVDVADVVAHSKPIPPAPEAAVVSEDRRRMRALNAVLVRTRERAETAEAALEEITVERKELAARAFWPLVGALLALSRFSSRLLRALKGERRNPLFDEAFYLDRYPFVRATGMDPYAHYLEYGAAAGLDPSPDFVTDWYLRSNPDVAASGANPLDHFLRYGSAEGRAPRPDSRSV